MTLRQKRTEIKKYFNDTFDLYESLFELLKDDDAFYEKPNSLRHPLIFYFGHTATFFINKLIAANIIKDRLNSEYESIFAVGVDEMSWDDFKAKAKLAKIFLFCSPHNPVGRVWTREELEKMSQICHENGVTIISDEIHSDLTHYGQMHIPMAKIAPDITITLNSPAKRFNIPSIVNSYAIIKDEKLRQKFYIGVERYAPHTPSPLIEEITLVAYEDSNAWLGSIDNYLAYNLAFITESLNYIPKIKAITPEASFLLWLDCRELDMNSNKLSNLFVNRLKLGLNSGSDFGGDGFMRLNYATPMSVIIEAMNRLKHIYN